jgi:hypothetical protein
MKLYEKVEMIYNPWSFSDLSPFPPVVHFVGIIVYSFSHLDACIGLFDVTTIDFHRWQICTAPRCAFVPRTESRQYTMSGSSDFYQGFTGCISIRRTAQGTQL